MTRRVKMTDMKEFYQELLDLSWPWMVERVELDKNNGRVDIWLTHAEDVKWRCPKCGHECGLSGHADEREWSHLDTCQFATIVHARLPRVNCPDHKGAQVTAPWAEGNSHFTFESECRAIDVMLECSLTGAERLTGMTWDMLWPIMENSAARGLKRKGRVLPESIGVDEKSFAKGHKYETIVCDLKKGTVEYVADGRGKESLDGYFKQFTEEEKASVKSVSMDMSGSYTASVRKHIPDADEKIVFDRFHIMKEMTKALDTVRKRENKELLDIGDETLKKTRYMWLRNEENIPEWLKPEFEELKKLDLKVGRAWSIKENLRRLWECPTVEKAREFFNRWFFWATHSRLKPIIAAAETLKTHMAGILAYFKNRVTNACAEGLNSKIETMKKMACGFKNREHFKTAIYFHCGGLDLYPKPD